MPYEGEGGHLHNIPAPPPSRDLVVVATVETTGIDNFSLDIETNFFAITLRVWRLELAAEYGDPRRGCCRVNAHESSPSAT